MAKKLTRREFVKISSIFPLILTTGCEDGFITKDCCKHTAKTKKPNLLLIYTDQQSLWTISEYARNMNHWTKGLQNKPIVQTPNIDSLAQQGAICRNFYVNYSLCSPSRAILFTGRYPYQNGVYTNNCPIHSDEITLANVLLSEGYRTGYAGKWHLDGTAYPGWIWLHRNMGFEDSRHMFNNFHGKKITEDKTGAFKTFDVWPQTNAKGILQFTGKPDNIGDEKKYTTDWLADKTVAFIKETKNKPFFYVLSIPDPHGSYIVRPPYDTLFNPDDMPLPPTFDQEDAPSWMKEAHDRYAHIYGIEKGNPHRKDNMRKLISQYLGMVKCIDDNVGKVIQCLKSEGIFDDTIIVFTTDHGEYLGEHTMYGKGGMYNTAYNVPFIVCWGRRIPAGTEVEQFITALDFKQTMLGLLRRKPTGNEKGKDASALLLGEKKTWKNEVVVYGGDYTKFRYGMLGIFTQYYHMGLSKDSSDGILFDQQKDPQQINNLFFEPAYKKVMRELRAKIIKHLKKEHSSQKMYWQWICNVK